VVDEDALQEYPEDGPIPIPCMQTLATGTVNAEGSSYTSYSEQANSEAFASEDSTGTVPVTCVGMFDTNSVDSTYKGRKLDALRKILKDNEPFVRISSGDEPQQTSYNPKIYGQLFPSLFPYGVGMFEDPSREDVGFSSIDLKAHVRHLISLADRRFQKHFTFIFVMMNLIQRRTSSFQCKLGVKRSWFPKVKRALDRADMIDTLKGLESKFAAKPSSRPESDIEKEALSLLKYVRYISGNISGSTAETSEMREQIRAAQRVHGLPHLYVTINPADSHNPIAQVLAGRNIDLDQIFSSLSPNAENVERARTMAISPVAGARFFDTLMGKFLGIVLGHERPNGKGIFGPVKSYYGVVEVQGHGSLHSSCHMFVWLEGGLSPAVVRERIADDMDFRERLKVWLEDIIKMDFPANTSTIRVEPSAGPSALT
jgi:hypothetical protein